MNNRGNKQPKLLCIVGNIGAGKSTLFGQLQQHFAGNEKVFFITECIEHCAPYLDAYYKGELNATAFQALCMASCSARLMKLKIPQGSLVISDRGMLDTIIFTEMYMLQQKIGILDKQVIHTAYELWHDAIKKAFNVHYLYFKQPCTDDTYAAVKMRGRKCESNITFEFLDQLENIYDIHHSHYWKVATNDHSSNLNTIAMIEELLHNKQDV